MGDYFTMSEAVISVNNLTKRYGSFTAANSLSFEVYKGEIFGLLGPNGAGKTTTLEIIETLREPDSGTINVLGMDWASHKHQIRSRIGIQLQSSDYFPNLNLVEVLQLFAALYQSSVKPMEVLATVGLESKAKTQFKDLSGGQQQRFSIATTFINDPDIIFLDEPTTGLDPQARRNLWELIRSLKDRGATVVLTTHYMDEAEELADRVAIIDSGNILRLDTPDNLIDQLIEKGFHKTKSTKQANLEDVFLDLTGKNLRES